MNETEGLTGFTNYYDWNGILIIILIAFVVISITLGYGNFLEKREQKFRRELGIRWLE